MKKIPFLIRFSLLIFLHASAVSAQKTQIRLEVGKNLQREIIGGETQSYNVTMSANQFLSLTVNQFATDVIVRLVAPDGKTVADVDLPLGGSVIERFWYIAPSAENYQLQIVSKLKSGAKGKYDVKLVELRAADEKAEKIVNAAKLSAEAFVLQEQNTAAGFLGAIEKYKQAVALAQESGERSAEMMPRVWMGVFYALLGQAPIALEQNEAAMKIARELGDRAAEAQILDNFGRVYASADVPKSLDYFTQALNLRNEIGARSETTTSLSGIGSAYIKTGKYEKAIEIFNQAIEIYRETENESGAAQMSINLAVAYGYLGEHQKAIETYQKALAFYRKTKISIVEVTLLSNIGTSSEALGELQKALDFYNEAVTVARATGNRAVELRALNNTGGVYAKLGDPATGLEYILAALPIARELKQPGELAVVINNLGFLYVKLNDLEKALTYFNESLQIVRQSSEKLSESYTLNNIATIYLKQGKLQEALTIFQQSLEIRRGLNNQALLAAAFTGIGNTYAALGDQIKAGENLAEALALVRTVSDPRQESETLYALARLQNKTNKLDEARKNIDAAIKIIESIRSRVAAQDLRTSYLAEVSDYYELRTEILMNLHKARPDENFDALALESAENAKARSLLDLLNESRADIRQGVDPALLERERAARQTLSAKANRQTKIFADKNSTAEQKTAIQTEVNSLTEDYEKIQTEIRRLSPRYAALTQPVPISVKEIQKQILDRDTVLLEYALGDEQSFLWVVGQNSIKSYVLPKRQEIEKAARQAYESLTVRNRSQNAGAKTQSSNEQAVAELGKVILAPAAADLTGKRLLIVADGALQYVPFEILSANSGKKESPLVATNEIVSLPSAATLIALRREKNNSNIGGSITLVADPVFETDDSRVLSKVQNKADDKTENLVKTAKRSADESGLTNFSRLRFSRDEADNIAAIAAKMNPIEIVDFEANKENITGGKTGKSNIIHFATHGLINSQHPELSGIVLSLVNEKGESKDGFLRLFEIYNLSLDADLVVLSACQTALGREIKGEGLIGLTRGFMYAGSPRVVASLWSVDDRATSELMRRFYQKLLRDKMRPAAALRAAQIEMRQNPRFSDPYFWAAFTLQGEWK